MSARELKSLTSNSTDCVLLERLRGRKRETVDQEEPVMANVENCVKNWLLLCVEGRKVRKKFLDLPT